MSSITTAPGALTTIFTPPTSCFASSDFPSFWTYCYSDWEASTFPIQCYWSRPASCYPTGGISYVFPNPPEWSWTGFEGEILGAMYHSPGVLPFGFAPPTQFLPSTAKASVTFVESNPVDETRVLGCLSGWKRDPYYIWCATVTEGSYVVNQTLSSGTLVANLPPINVKWAEQDLMLFTPASAPVLPTAVLQSYEASIAAARSRSSAAEATTTSIQSTQTSQQAAHSATPGNTSSSGDNLSTGAKAGIGVGVAVGVLALLLLIFLLLRRRKQMQRREVAAEPHQPPRRDHSNRAYLDAKSELPARERRLVHEQAAEREPQEVAAGREPQEMAASREPPPVPFASKPRWNAMHEVE